MNDQATHSVIQAIQDDFPVHRWSNFKTLLAVSGGPDSVALAHAFQRITEKQPELRKNLLIGHVNHATRSQCEQEEQFVQRLGNQLEIKVVCRKRQPADSSSEEALRNDRYRLLEEIADEQGARFVVTGHHRQDQVETILFRLFRGTGIDGLAGIPSRRRMNHGLTLVRPMLQLGKPALIEFLNDVGATWFEDDSNQDVGYSRNHIRHQVLPLIAERFGGPNGDSQFVENRILRLAAQAEQFRELMDSLVAPLLIAAVHVETNQLRIVSAPLKDQHPMVVQSVIRQAWTSMEWPQQEMTAQWWNRLARLVLQGADTKPFDLPGSIRCESNARELLLEFRK